VASTDASIEAVKTHPRLENWPYVFDNLATKDLWSECRKLWNNTRVAVGLPELLVRDLLRQYSVQLKLAVPLFQDSGREIILLFARCNLLPRQPMARYHEVYVK